MICDGQTDRHSHRWTDKTFMEGGDIINYFNFSLTKATGINFDLGVNRVPLHTAFHYHPPFVLI